MPMETAISAVMANHSRVWPARRAALETCLRLAMLTITAVTISGGTSTFSSVTKVPPTVCEGAGQPVGRAVGDGADLPGDEPEDDADDEGEEDLRRERDAAETSEHEECLSERVRGRGDGAAASTGRGRHPAEVEGTPRVRPHRFCTGGSMRTVGARNPGCGQAHACREASSGSGCR